ncbi:MAG: LptA/OstA family protein, partial [Planctomycetes bacterium]|nr:LptA/OstA family protein [Planctomycetota bacterium]
PEDAGWMSSDKLRVIQHKNDDPELPGHIELVADGNAELEGRTFNAQADVISYDESKGLYILRSDGNRKATIWRQTEPGASPSDAQAQRMEFIPSRKQLKLVGTSGLSGLQ